MTRNYWVKTTWGLFAAMHLIETGYPILICIATYTDYMRSKLT